MLPYERTVNAEFYAWFVYWFIPLWLSIFALHGLYNPELIFGGTQEYTRLFQSSTIGIVMLVFYSFLDRSDDNFNLSRGWLAFVFIAATAALLIERFAIRHVIHGTHGMARLHDLRPDR